MFVVFLVLNSALKKENIYTPSMKENNTNHIQNFDGLTLKSEKKVYLYGIAMNSEERDLVISEAKEILDVEDVITSILLVEDLRIQKN